MLDLRESILQSLGSNGLQFPSDETSEYSYRLDIAIAQMDFFNPARTFSGMPLWSADGLFGDDDLTQLFFGLA
jgi:hypothetical protein